MLQGRHPDEAVLHEDFELVPVVGEQGELEIGGDPVHAPGLGLGLETAEDQAAHLFLEVDVAVGVAHHREVGRDTVDLPGDDVHVLARMERHGDVGQPAHLPGPLPGAVDDDVARDVAGVGAHPGRGTVLDSDAGNARLLEDPGARRPRAPGQGLGEVGGIGLAVAGKPDGANEVIGAHHRPFPAGDFGRDHLGLDAEGARQGGRAAQQDHAVLRTRHGQAAAPLPARRQPGFRLQHAVQLGAVLDQPGHVVVGPELPDQARRVPRGAAAQASLFEHHHVVPAQLGQVVGDAAADDAAADDHGARLGRQILFHVPCLAPNSTFRVRGRYPPGGPGTVRATVIKDKGNQGAARGGGPRPESSGRHRCRSAGTGGSCGVLSREIGGGQGESNLRGDGHPVALDRAVGVI